MGSRGNLLVGLTAVGLVVGTATTLWAETTQAVKLPVTIQDHLALAKSYEEKAAAYHQEATYHREMLEEYKHKVVVNPKSPYENPWLKKMRKHCEAIIQESERLAREMHTFAEWHRMRAAELEGR